MSTARAKGMSRQESDQHFELLRKVLTENNLLNTPQKIFNIDETGLQLNNNPGKVLAAKGTKMVNCITSAEKGETISVISCVNAEGGFLPPCCIFKGKNKKAEFEDDLPPGGKIFMGEKSAYVTSEIFFEWFRQIFVPRKGVGKVLLLLDGHSSHCSNIDLLDYAVANDVILFCLPSHTTHWLQPLDRSFFKPLKTYWSQVCQNWVHTHPGRKLGRLQFASLLNTAWCKAATIQNGTSGFRTCGIYPFNPDVIPDYAFVMDEEEVVEMNPNLEQDPNEVPDNDSSLNRQVKNPFEDILPIPQIEPGTSDSQRKQHAEILTSPETIIAKRAKKEENIIKLKRKEDNKQTKMKKIVEHQKKNKTLSRNELKRTAKLQKNRCVSSSSESDSENVTQESGDSEMEIDDSDYCASCRGYFYDKKGPKCEWMECVRCSKWSHEICTPSDIFCAKCASLPEKVTPTE